MNTSLELKTTFVKSFITLVSAFTVTKPIFYLLSSMFWPPIWGHQQDCLLFSNTATYWRQKLEANPDKELRSELQNVHNISIVFNLQWLNNVKVIFTWKCREAVCHRTASITRSCHQHQMSSKTININHTTLLGVWFHCAQLIVTVG